MFENNKFLVLKISSHAKNPVLGSHIYDMTLRLGRPLIKMFVNLIPVTFLKRYSIILGEGPNLMIKNG